MWKTDEVPKVYLTALCAWREARGCESDAIRGVIHVIQNRAHKPSWWGHGYVGVILKPMQFSSFNAGDPNATKFPDDDDKIFKQIIDITDRILNNQDEDNTGGATHYHSADVFPDWAAKAERTAKIGPFAFYKVP